MAEASSLLEEEDVDENIQLLNFYQNHEIRALLRRIFLDKVPPNLKFYISAFFSSTYYDEDYEWKQCLYDLGVDLMSIKAIEFKARSFGVPPLYVALNGTLEANKSFGAVIEVLCSNKKFHILRHIKPFVEGLLNNDRRIVKDEESEHPTNKATAPEYQQYANTLKVNSSSNYDIKFGECNLLEFPNNCEAGTHIRESAKSQNITGIHMDFQEGLPISIDIKKPKMIGLSSETYVSVFILHTALDKKLAKQLAKCLREKNFRVILSADISHRYRVNHTKILKAVHNEVDFIVPVVSEMFLKQISSGECMFNEADDVEIKATRFMYDLVMNEYSMRDCNNYSVKPVCISRKVTTMVGSDQILSWCFQLWDEVPKFIHHLKEAKAHLLTLNL